MSRDIDEIALMTAKAIGNIDPDKLPGGRTQANAQAQILVRDAIEKQLEQAEAKADLFRRACEDLLDDRPIARAFILRKQAGAVESAVERSRDHLNECAWPLGGIPDDAEHALQEVEGHAQRLRNQADEAERAGGDQ